MFKRGKLPEDGFKGSVVGSSHYRLRPYFMDGERLSGTINVPMARYMPDGITYRILLNGEPVTEPIDTTKYPDGSYVLSGQILEDNSGKEATNGSRLVTINNSGIPLTSKKDMCVITDFRKSVSTAWGQLDVLENKPHPIDPQLDRHPIASTEADRERLVNDRVWWMEGLTDIGTGLWGQKPTLMKNKDGDYFIKAYNSQSGVVAANAQPYVENSPAYDGPRGIGCLSPYASVTPYFMRRLPSGEFGWMAIEKSGRVLTVDITGEVETVLGPRSVEGVIGTDHEELTVDLDDRLANGEKEMVGTISSDKFPGPRLNLPHDHWPCSSFPFEGIIADTGNNTVTEIHYEKSKLMRRFPLAGVTSVCDSHEIQNDIESNLVWVAVTPEGLFGMRHRIADISDEEAKKRASESPHLFGTHGYWMGHGDDTLEKLADIPDAFWVRVDGMRVYVLTLDLGIYEYDPLTHEVTELVPRRVKKESYVFMNVDLNGSIGPAGRIYLGSPSQYNGGWASSKTRFAWYDPRTGVKGYVGKSKLINMFNGSQTTYSDQMGHYLWGFSIHDTLPKMLVCGISSSTWFMWTGCLGETPEADAKCDWVEDERFYINLFKYGILDSCVAPSFVFGYQGHSMIGYSVDDFSDYPDYPTARVALRALVDPILPPEMPEDHKDKISNILFNCRTRRHFLNEVTIPTPEPEPPVEPPVEPDPEPPVEPDPDPGPDTPSIELTGKPPYTVTITDSEGNKINIKGSV